MILVTGSTGLTGSHLLYTLLSQGKTVKALVRSNSNKQQILHTFSYYTDNSSELFEKIIWVYADVTDKQSLADAFENVTQVYHTAAYVSFNNRNRNKIFEINIEGTANIVNICLERKNIKLLHISSIAALGESENGEIVDEINFWKPKKRSSAYSFSKFKSEMEVWRGITEGLNAVIINPSVILGPGQWEQGSSQLIPRAAKGMKFYTSGSTGFVDVRDVVDISIQLMESNISGERFIANGTNIDYYHFFENIAIQSGISTPKMLVPKFLLAIAWRFEAFKAFIFGTEPKITKSFVKISFKKVTYSSQKVIERLAYRFVSLEDTILNVLKCYKKDKKLN